MAKEKETYTGWLLDVAQSILLLISYTIGGIFICVVISFFLALFLEDRGRYDEPSPIFHRVLQKSLDTLENS
jgi:hypothetical protein